MTIHQETFEYCQNQINKGNRMVAGKAAYRRISSEDLFLIPVFLRSIAIDIFAADNALHTNGLIEPSEESADFLPVFWTDPKECNCFKG